MPQIIVSLVISALMVLGSVAYNSEQSKAVGASQSISSLTELTSLSHNDVLPITEVNGLTTKKVKWGTATSTLKVINDALYSPIIGSASITTLGTITTGTWNADTITVAKGGTGSTSLIAYQLLAGNGTGAVTTFGNGTSGYVLTSNGAGALPSFQNVGVTTNNNNTWTGTNTFTATTTFSGPVTIDGIIRTPNNESDGSLNVTSGTVTLNDASHVSGDYAIYNYSTGTIAVGATLTTGANLKNKILVLRFTGTTTIAGTIDLSGKGASGGALATNGTAGASTFAYSVGIKGSSSVSTPGAGGLSSDFALYDVWCGSGGGGGVSKGLAGGVGGDGGGGIILVTTGTLSFTGTLNMSGIAGTSATHQGTYNFLNSDGGSGGGGGGAGKGLFFAQYFNADATKYTIIKTGGAASEGSKPVGASGGSPPVQAAASGAGGGASGATAGSAGANGGTNNSPSGSQGAGGAGADGAFYIGKIPPVNLMQI